MRSFAGSLRDLFGKRSAKRRATRPAPRRLELERLEDRWVPTAPTPQLASAVSGIIFVDHNGTGVFGPGDATIGGVDVTLSTVGSGTYLGKSINASTVTASDGSFSFQNVPAGKYQISIGPIAGYLPGPAALGDVVEPSGVNLINLGVTAGPGTNNNIGVGGLDPNFINWSQFLTSTTSSAFDFAAAGTGKAAASVPFTTNTLGAVSLTTTSSADVIDLSADFSAPDITDTMVQLQTNFGNINLELFDTIAPQTVTNYLNYVTSGRYNNSIFERSTPISSGFGVLQGGSFTVPASGATALPSISDDPPINNEVDLPNTVGTISMAMPNSPNSATSGFFFNLTDNSNSLSPAGQAASGQDTGGFTVFGKVADAASMQVLNAMAAVPTISETIGGGTDTVPLQNYTPQNPNQFPADTTAANYLVVNNAVVLSQNEQLTYSAAVTGTTGIVNVSVTNERLTITPVATGTTTITVTATDQYGSTTQQSFSVTVS